MPVIREFGRRFKEVVAGKTQSEAGEELGVTQAYISRMVQGSVPRLEVLERIIKTYELPRDEWLRLAGYLKDQEAPDPDTDLAHLLEQAAAAGARRAVEELTARGAFGWSQADKVAEPLGRYEPGRSGLEEFLVGAAGLEEKYERPVLSIAMRLRRHGGLPAIKLEDVPNLLAAVEELLAESLGRDKNPPSND